MLGPERESFEGLSNGLDEGDSLQEAVPFACIPTSIHVDQANT